MRTRVLLLIACLLFVESSAGAEVVGSPGTELEFAL